MNLMMDNIDLVNLINYQLVEKYESQLSHFISRKSLAEYRIDGYIIKMYPEIHPYSTRSQADLLYWEHWFSKSRMNRKKERKPKGFVELS